MTALLQVDNLSTYFETDRGTVKSVDGISFEIGKGEILGLVGESGSGKSITGFSLIGLIDKHGRIQPGSSIRFEGRELVGLPENQLRSIRGREVSMVFQDPMMTLNPVLKVIDQIAMAIRAHEKLRMPKFAAERSKLWRGCALSSQKRRSTSIHISFQVACANAWRLLLRCFTSQNW